MAEKQNHRRSGGKQQADARKEARRAAREAVLALLFEMEFHEEDTPEAIFLRAVEARDLDGTDRYVRTAYEGILNHLDVIDTLIGRHAQGWRTGRLSRVSRAVLRLGTYELVYNEKIPAPIAINEAVELAKRYDEPRARAFVNGVLNAIKDELAANGEQIPAEVLAALQAETAEMTPATAVPVVAVETTAESEEADAPATSDEHDA